jgi:hypothetical protein
MALTAITGCFSTKAIGINTVSSYEKRYTSNSEITINGEKVEIPEGKSVWVLRGETLEVLLSTASANNLSNVKQLK